jgi:DNA primase
MALIPEDKILEIKNSSDIVEIISGYVSLKKAGINYKAQCPFHAEKTPSFIVSPSKQIFHCFGCGAGGNVFHYIMKVENLEFIEAVRFLAEKKGIVLDEKEDKTRKLNDTIFSANEFAAKFYRNNLKSSLGKNGSDYLLKRKISHETLEKFSVGLAPDSWEGLLNSARKNAIPDWILEKAGLAVKRENKEGFYDRFRNRIIFPITNNSGRIAGFGGRVLDNSLPKYINSPESPVYSKGKNLYGWNIAKEHVREKDSLILVEGYMDCIACHQYGFCNTTAVLGTAFTKQQAELIKKYTDNVIISFDLDAAGLNASLRGFDILLEEGLNVSILTVSEGKDPDEFLRIKGADAFKSSLNEALDFVDFWTDIAVKGDKSTLDKKISILNKILPLIKKVQDPVKQGYYIEKAARKLGVEERLVWKKMEQSNTAAPKKNEKTESPGVLNSSNSELVEKELIQLILGSNEAAERIRNEIFAGDFENPFYAKIAGIIFESLAQDANMDISEMLNKLDSGSLNIITNLALSKRDYADEVKVEKDLVKKMRINRIKNRLAELEPEVRKLHKAEVDKELINEYFQLQKFLKGNKK